MTNTLATAEDICYYSNELGSDHDVYATINDGHVTFTWREGMNWHLARNLATWRIIDNVRTTPGADNALAAWLRAYDATTFGPDLSVEIDDCDDEAVLLVHITHPVPEGARGVADIQPLLTPFEAALVNVTDPGTFGVPYLFARVLDTMQGERPTPDDMTGDEARDAIDEYLLGTECAHANPAQRADILRFTMETGEGEYPFTPRRMDTSELDQIVNGALEYV